MTLRPRLALLPMIVLALAASPAAATVVGEEPQAVEDAFRPAPEGYAVTSWIEGLEAPWSLVFLPDGRALVSERPGRIRLIEEGRLREEPYATVEAAHVGEGGLMGLALHPDFPDQPFVYAMHTHRNGGGMTNRVIRLRHEGESASLDRMILDDIPGARFHNGGRIAFGPDGMLYVATGEIFQRQLAQDPESLAGKILRLTPEGAVPDNNPFAGSPVYSLGHRNPQGLAWHPETGDLFSAEHGPSGEVGFGAWDEVNVIEPGANYGWPEVVGAAGIEEFTDPIVAWRDNAVPPGGIAFHDGDLFVATLRSEALVRIALDETAEGYSVAAIEHWFAERPGDGVHGRFRDVVVGPDGALYALTSNRDGRGRVREGDDRILRIERSR